MNGLYMESQSRYSAFDTKPSSTPHEVWLTANIEIAFKICRNLGNLLGENLQELVQTVEDPLPLNDHQKMAAALLQEAKTLSFNPCTGSGGADFGLVDQNNELRVLCEVKAPRNQKHGGFGTLRMADRSRWRSWSEEQINRWRSLLPDNLDDKPTLHQLDAYVLNPIKLRDKCFDKPDEVLHLLITNYPNLIKVGDMQESHAGRTLFAHHSFLHIDEVRLINLAYENSESTNERNSVARLAQRMDIELASLE